MKSTNTKRRSARLKAQYRIPPPMKAIRAKCMDCMGGSPKSVNECNIPGCELYPYRFGHNPQENDLRAPVFNRSGDLVGWQEWQGYGEPMDCRQTED